MVLQCYKQNGRHIWLDNKGTVWNFHPLKKEKSLAGGMGAFRIQRANNSSFLSRIKEKVRKTVPLSRPEVVNVRPFPSKNPIVPFGNPRKFDLPKRPVPELVSDVIPSPTRGNKPHHRTYGANLDNDEGQMQLAVEANPKKDKGVFLPSSKRFNLPPQQSQMSTTSISAQSSQDSQNQGNGFGKDLLDRFKNGDVDITKTVTDIKTIVDAFKGNGNSGGGNPTPIYIPVDRGGDGSGGTVSEKNDNTLMILAALGVLTIGGAILLKED